MNLKVPQFEQVLPLNEPLNGRGDSGAIRETGRGDSDAIREAGRGDNDVIREAGKACGKKYDKIRKRVN
jgi:hypothetical protein